MRPDNSARDREIIRLAKRGRTYRWIATQFKLSSGRIALICKSAIGPRKTRLNPHREEIIRLATEGMTYAKIAKSLGTTRNAVAGVLSRTKQEGLHKLGEPPHVPFNSAEAQSLYDQGLSDPEIGKRIGFSASVIWKWRQKNNLPSHFSKNEKPKTTPEVSANSENVI